MLKPFLAGALALGMLALASARTQQRPMGVEPSRQRGTSVTPAFEGWYPNPDGSFTLLVGYYNRNSMQTFDVPVGPDNNIEPGPADQGQPTYFEVGRQWGVFAVRVPKDFGDKAVTWTIAAGAERQSIPLTLNKDYLITPFKEAGTGNRPPVLSFAQGGPAFTGPPNGIAAALTGKVGDPIAFTIGVMDPKIPEQGGHHISSAVATVSLHKYRGPGTVTFASPRFAATTQGERLTTTGIFSAAGEYVVRVQANDESGEGGGGFQCCWTNALVKVTVR